MTTKDPRDSGRWRRLRAELRAGAIACPICNRTFDHTRPRTSRYPAVDHINPVEHGGDPFDRNNLRVVCTGCNSRKSARIRNGTAPRAATITPIAPRVVCPGHGPACPTWHSRNWG